MHHFDDIRDAYERSYRQHGDSPASLLCPKGRQHLRFSAAAPFLMEGKVSILDYGCGLGHMLQYLDGFDGDFEYHGVDIVPDFIHACSEKHGERARFDLISPEDEIEGSYDIVFASGVFNLRSCEDEEVSRGYVRDRLRNLYRCSKTALVCDFLTGYVDFQQEGAQHFSVAEITDFCVSDLTRRFVIRHDLLPYEFTLVAMGNNEILRPDNVYGSSAPTLDGP